jgi:hypothetical protein
VDFKGFEKKRMMCNRSILASPGGTEENKEKRIRIVGVPAGIRRAPSEYEFTALTLPQPCRCPGFRSFNADRLPSYGHRKAGGVQDLADAGWTRVGCCSPSL